MLSYLTREKKMLSGGKACPNSLNTFPDTSQHSPPSGVFCFMSQGYPMSFPRKKAQQQNLKACLAHCAGVFIYKGDHTMTRTGVNAPERRFLILRSLKAQHATQGHRQPVLGS